LRVGEGRQPVLIAGCAEVGHRHTPSIEIETRKSVRFDAAQADLAGDVLPGAYALAYDAQPRAAKAERRNQFGREDVLQVERQILPPVEDVYCIGIGWAEARRRAVRAVVRLDQRVAPKDFRIGR